MIYGSIIYALVYKNTMNYYDTGYNTGYAQPYTAPEMPAFNIMDYTPMGMLKNQLWCMAVGIVIFMILMYLISLIPVIGPWVSNKIKWLIAKLAEFAGVINCGFANDFDAVLAAED
jgi:hypothetical protein